MTDHLLLSSVRRAAKVGRWRTDKTEWGEPTEFTSNKILWRKNVSSLSPDTAVLCYTGKINGIKQKKDRIARLMVRRVELAVKWRRYHKHGTMAPSFLSIDNVTRDHGYQVPPSLVKMAIPVFVLLYDVNTAVQNYQADDWICLDRKKHLSMFGFHCFE